MNKFFQTALTAIYVSLTAITVLILLKICAVPLNSGVALLFVAAWTFFCFSTVRFSTGISLFLEWNVRKPILAEEERLQRCLDEVLQRAGAGLPEKRLELFIAEDAALNAFAIGRDTIILTRGIIGEMTDDELKGIMAHELGHLMSRDGVIIAAFNMAARLPKIIKWGLGMIRLSLPVRLILRRILQICRKGSVGGIILLLVVTYLFYREGLLLPLAALVGFVKLSGWLEPVFRFLFFQVSRFTEYKQDAYAYHLGYGKEIRQALYKMTLTGPQSVNPYSILIKSSHPVIYNRIRKLEELEGLR
jgi:Zn-dependent protease with chaperone function